MDASTCQHRAPAVYTRSQTVNRRITASLVATLLLTSSTIVVAQNQQIDRNSMSIVATQN